MTEDMLKSLRTIEGRLPNINFSEEQIPDRLPPNPTITITREKLESFRLSYQILLETLADIVGVDYRRLNILELLKYYYQKSRGDTHNDK